MEVVINRLRIGHAGTNQYLHRFNMADAQLCSKCNTIETIEHVLLYCSKYTVNRKTMEEELLKINVTSCTNYLLGSSSFSLSICNKINKILIKCLMDTNMFSIL